jgi:hypothetical protein
MKQIEYPDSNSDEYTNLINAYLAIFEPELESMEERWLSWKKLHKVKVIKYRVKDLLIADATEIAKLYDQFIALNISSTEIDKSTKKKCRSKAYSELDDIFKYTNGYDGTIANFFIDRASQLHISTCFYCELSYINTYTVKTKNVTRRQFDLDHFIPRSKCPILGLSLFNFVPSCQVCNSRLKSDDIIGGNSEEYIKFNPTSKEYTFDSDVEIRLRMNELDTKFDDGNNFRIEFKCKNSYEKVVSFFHLDERYDFHKNEAIRLIRLTEKYPDSAINKISHLLSRPAVDIKEDLFNLKYVYDYDR